VVVFNADPEFPDSENRVLVGTRCVIAQVVTTIRKVWSTCASGRGKAKTVNGKQS